MEKKNKITILFFIGFSLLDFLSSIHLLSFGYCEQNIIYSFIGDYFWVFYWIISIGILTLLLKTKKLIILNIVSVSHLICGIHNLGLII